jgi:pimeloyl-ACP methyl ester carboxylesterase
MPFMHNPSLPHLLTVAAKLPTLLVWGREDRVVPLNAAQIYKRALPDARQVIFDDCGHRPEVEKPAEFIRAVEEFLG